MKNITYSLFNEFKEKNTKIGKKIFNIFNLDLCEIILNNNTWWLEKHSQYSYIPNYFIDYLRNYLKRKYNYTYLYDKGGILNDKSK